MTECECCEPCSELEAAVMDFDEFPQFDVSADYLSPTEFAWGFPVDARIRDQ